MGREELARTEREAAEIAAKARGEVARYCASLMGGSITHATSEHIARLRERAERLERAHGFWLGLRCLNAGIPVPRTQLRT
jgi:hypothetical protein